MWVIPLLSAISLEWLKLWKPVNAFIVRKERKETWLWNKIEGEVWDVPIILIDDLYNSGNSFLKIVRSLEAIHKKASYFFAFVHFGNQAGIERLIENNIFIHYPFTLSDFWLTKWKEEEKHSVITPKIDCIYALKNPNRFLIVPKSNPLLYKKLIICWWEGWAMVWIEKDTGYILWSFQTWYHAKHKSILSSPVIKDGTIFFGAYDWNFYALDGETGALKWKNTFADFIGSSPTVSEKHNLLYIWTEHSSRSKWGLMAVHASTGEIEWFQPFSDFVHCSPWYSTVHDMVICWGNDMRIIICKWDTGEIIHDIEVDGEVKGWFWFSWDEDRVYFWSWSWKLYCLNIRTWKILWEYKTDGLIYTTPLVNKSGIFFWSYDKYFYHLGTDGLCIKKVKTGWKIASSANFLSDEIIMFWSNDGVIYFYNSTTHKVITTIIHGERITTKLLMENSSLYFSDHLNRLFRINNINCYPCLS